jgi:CBS domain-containing protein/tetratricopeptide (TPR) repeat protein
VNLDELLQHLTAYDDARAAQDRALREFADACRQVDDNPRERRRIRDIADLIDAEDALYEEAVAAVKRGDQDRALPLLRRAAQAGIGEAAWLLAGLLEERGETTEAITWYQQAAADGDSRAEAKLAELYSRQAGHGIIISHILWRDNTDSYPPAKLEGGDRESLVAWLGARVSAGGGGLASWASWMDRQLWSQEDFGRRWATDLAAAPFAELWQPLKTPHHGACATTEDLARWPSGDRKTRHILSLVEGSTDEAAARHWLTAYPYFPAGVMLFVGCMSQADTGADLIHTLDDRTQECQVKVLNYLRHRLSRTLAAPVTSWQIEHRAASDPTASDVMTPLASLATLAPATTVHQAMGQALEADALALLVCDDQQAVGVVTLADLARCMHDSRGVISIERVETLMRPPAAVGMTAPLSVVRTLMARQGTSLVAVTGPGGMTVGCITAQALLASEPVSQGNARPEQHGRPVPLLRPDRATVHACVPV